MAHLMKLVLVLSIISCTVCKKAPENEKPEWAKKDITDYTDVDLERLLDQWEEDEDPLPDDELPEHLRPKPKIQFDPSDATDPEALLRMSKKGQTLMMFVKVLGKYSKEEADQLTQRWQTALWNNHIQAERYMIDESRAIFMFKDGSQAWDGKDYLVQQSELEECTLENKVYKGDFAETPKDEL